MRRLARLVARLFGRRPDPLATEHTPPALASDLAALRRAERLRRATCDTDVLPIVATGVARPSRWAVPPPASPMDTIRPEHRVRGIGRDDPAPASTGPDLLTPALFVYALAGDGDGGRRDEVPSHYEAPVDAPTEHGRATFDSPATPDFSSGDSGVTAADCGCGGGGE